MGKLILGLVFEDEMRKAKAGWMLFQWFSFETLEQDGIITKVKEKCEELSAAYGDLKVLAEIIRIDEEEYSYEKINDDNRSTSEVESVNNFVKIMQADKNGILLTHPWVISRLNDRIRELWLSLAKAAGVKFRSVITQSDESLAHYHTVLPSGKIEGHKVFCAPDFPEGEYILFVNPIRHWGDVQLWHNKYEGTYTGATGILAAPRLLLLSLGCDTDGGFVQLIESSKYPAMREEIANFPDSPAVQQLPKIALPSTLQENALRSMKNTTGIVISLLGRARSKKLENVVIEIPPGGMQTEVKEMRVIDFLSQELQIAVDSRKSAYPNNEAGLTFVKQFMDARKAEIPWLKGFKNPTVYKTHPCPVNPNAKDTISRLVKLVNSYWTPTNLLAGTTPQHFQHLLYSQDGGYDYDEWQLNIANQHRINYGKEMTEAIDWKDSHQGDRTRIRQVMEKFRQLKKEILELKNPNTGEKYHHQTWEAAFWFAAHKTEAGTAGCVFTMFSDEICMRLLEIKNDDTKVLSIYGCQYGSWAAPKDSKLWNGEVVNIRCYTKEYNGKIYTAIKMEWTGAQKQKGYHHLGNIGGKTTMALGTMKQMKIYSISWRDGVTSGVMLFDLSLRQGEIYKLLTRLGRKKAGL